MHSKPATFGIAVALLLCVFRTIGPRAQAGDAEISGRVDDASGVILPGVEVVAVGSDGKHAAVTGADGRCLLSHLEPGAYSLTAALPGFFPQTKKVSIASAGIGVVDFALRVGCLYHPLYVTESRDFGAVTWALRESGLVAHIRVRGRVGDGRPEHQESCDVSYIATVLRTFRTNSYAGPVPKTIDLLLNVYAAAEPGKEYVIWLRWMPERKAFAGVLQDEFIGAVRNGRVIWTGRGLPDFSSGDPVDTFFDALTRLAGRPSKR
ncbi:MAG TPA: carboxypeptidase-like regulatory domain-containing protein [Vicinamibacterales bacterium]|nr:carboxypeptidase-like regulatory domain-containing protein [Vicinamibacterales bacterium]